MNLALFGGTFDPIHVGHLRAARAAVRHFGLDRVLFIPSGNPPHKHRDRLTDFSHRYAMVALACAGEPRFVPSLLEAPRADGQPHYSISTVRRARKLFGPKAHLFFLIGADAFLDLPHWKQFRALLDSLDFIVVSRPGFGAAELGRALPASLLSPPPRRRGGSGSIQLRRTTLHLLEGVDAPVASSEIREARRRSQSITGLVPPLVEQYIWKEELYLPARPGRAQG